MFDLVPAREIVLHLSSALEDSEAPAKEGIAIRLLKTLPALIKLDSSRALKDALNIACSFVPIRYALPNKTTSMTQGSIYGVESAEDTSEAGQGVSASHKASLTKFLPIILRQLEHIISDNLEIVQTRTDKRNIILASLFLLSHSAASFRQSFEDSDESETQVPQPPTLPPVHRPSIKVDQEIQVLLVSTMDKICELVEKCGYSSVAMLWWYESVSSVTSRDTSIHLKDEYSTVIEVPTIDATENSFNRSGIAACLLHIMSAEGYIPVSWAIYNGNKIVSMLLSHAQALLTSRSVGGPFLVRRLLELHSPDSTFDIPYPLDYILEQEFMPHIAQRIFYVIRACIEFSVRMPDASLRQHTFAAMAGLVSLFDTNAQFKLLFLLSKTCPYSTAQSAIVHLMKESFLQQYEVALQAKSNSMQVDMNSEAKTEKKNAIVPKGSENPFLSNELFFNYFANQGLKAAGLDSRYDSMIASLNFLRAILLRDSQTKLCSVWEPENKNRFKKQVLDPLSAAILQNIAQHQNDNSYEDRQRIHKEMSKQGMGIMSIDQLAASQSQTILNWQLSHSILSRIEELL